MRSAEPASAHDGHHRVKLELPSVDCKSVRGMRFCSMRHAV
jgi:hypothetical protein